MLNNKMLRNDNILPNEEKHLQAQIKLYKDNHTTTNVKSMYKNKNKSVTTNPTCTS